VGATDAVAVLMHVPIALPPRIVAQSVDPKQLWTELTMSPRSLGQSDALSFWHLSLQVCVSMVWSQLFSRVQSEPQNEEIDPADWLGPAVPLPWALEPHAIVENPTNAASPNALTIVPIVTIRISFSSSAVVGRRAR
jgi:hypothetical protein